jgi:hypothetical protein
LDVPISDGSSTLGTGTLSAGTATFSTSALSQGSHAITAVYGGDSTFATSTSAVLLQSAVVPADSLKLRAMQIITTTIIAQNSGSAITAATDAAIAEGSSEGSNLITPSGGGIRFNFAAGPDQPEAANSGSTLSDRWSGLHRPHDTGGVLTGAINGYVQPAQSRSHIDDAFAAIDRKTMHTKAPPSRFVEPKNWLLWADVTGTGIDRWGSTAAAPLLYGNQVNALVGLTRRVTPTFLIGVLGGYEIFDYKSDVLTGHLKGGGWTIGSYLGWKFVPGLRFDVSAAYSGMVYHGAAGAALGNFSGHRWLAASGLTGTYMTFGLEVEPSAKLYALWEQENAYTDSLGTEQADRTFFTGRASAGVKVSYPWLYSATVALAPYAGLYADYYFTGDSAAAVALTGAQPIASAPFFQGWSVRATSGLAARFGNGAIVAIGAELGGIGGNLKRLSFSGRVSMPF